MRLAEMQSNQAIRFALVYPEMSHLGLHDSRPGTMGIPIRKSVLSIQTKFAPDSDQIPKRITHS